ncbi:MAG: helix-turn-helix transcriptional regulator [Acidothermaceae bacterium]
MSTRIAADSSPGPALGESRSRTLAVLQDAGRPLGVNDVAERMRLHPNTARFHLDGLADAGLVDRTMETRDSPGRPRALYAARPGSQRGGRRSYRLLAEILTSYIAGQSAKPTQAAREAGEAWGHYLAEKPPPYRRIDAAAATNQLLQVLDEVGFVPEATTVRRQRQVLLHHCPFREAAIEHREVVCSVHLGLMQGLLDEIDAPLVAEKLEPFVEPNLCVTHLAARK